MLVLKFNELVDFVMDPGPVNHFFQRECKNIKVAEGAQATLSNSSQSDISIFC